MTPAFRVHEPAALPDTGWAFDLAPGPGGDFAVPWDALRERLGSWIEPMYACPQDARWHAEGDVGIHTRMVCEALAALPAYRALPDPARSVAFLGALLHDVGKPACTYTAEDGRIRSTGHARAGIPLVRDILGGELAGRPPLPVREAVARLVLHHGAPMHFHKKPDPTRALHRLAAQVRLDLLALVAEADMRGREAADRGALVEQVALFREEARDLGCLGGPRRYASDHARFLYLSGARPTPDGDWYDDTRFTVTMMVGIPASGKDTWAGQNSGGNPVLSSDDLREELGIDPAGEQGPVFAEARERARVHLRAGTPFTWNATNLTRSRRQPWLDLFRRYGARVRIAYVSARRETTLARNAARVRTVPGPVMEKMMRDLEVPDPTEAQEVLWIESDPE